MKSYYPFGGDEFPDHNHRNNNSAEFIRPADCRQLFGLSRSFVYQLMAEGKIRSVSLRRRGKFRGVRLIDAQSVRDYLNGGNQTN